MHRTRKLDLPFVGISRQFIGADQGDVAVSAFLVDAPPGRGAVPHRHPYDTVAFVLEGRGTWTVGGAEREAGPGDILVVKAGEAHHFTNTGSQVLVLIDIHLGPRFEQENLGQG
jgi:quercetin dioxygenase-like cupin family protein